MESRLVRNLDAKVADGAYYDAHQLVRAIFERYAKKGDVEGGMVFAEKYAATFAEREQYELCVNLGQRALKLLQTTRQPFSEEYIGRLATLFCLCPPGTTDTKYEYMNELIKWSKRPGAENGSPDLHSMVADVYLAEEKYGACQNHLVFCDDVEALLTLVGSWQKACYPSEKYLVPLRLCLVLLYNKKFELVHSFLQKLPVVDWDSADCPAPLQLAYLTWAACQYNSHELYEQILRKYPLLFRLDPSLERLYNSIEREIFNIKKAPSGILGMMSQLMSGMQLPAA